MASSPQAAALGAAAFGGAAAGGAAAAGGTVAAGVPAAAGGATAAGPLGGAAFRAAGARAASAGGAAAASPFLWAGLAALFLGLALGEAYHWQRRARRGEEKAAARLSALAAFCLAVALAAGACVLILPEKASLGDPLLPYWAGLALACGLAAGLAPRAAGLPLLGLVLAAALLLVESLAGWLPLAGPTPVARLLPFSVGPDGFSGELEVLERDTVPTVQRLELKAASAALVVERLELAGPAALVAGPAFYRVVGLSGGPGGDSVSFPARRSLLERVLPLPEGPEAEARGLLVRRSREASAALPLAALEPVLYSLETGGGGEGLALVAAPESRPFGAKD